MADTAAPVSGQAKEVKAKPERPDEEIYKTDLAKAEKELRAAEDRMKAIKAKLDLARPNNKDSPSGKRQQELRTELSGIRAKQQTSKSSRTGILDKIKRLDENLKSRINESKTARGKVQYKSAEDVQRKIEELQAKVDAGNMRIVDEKQALSEISQLNRQKKGFAGFDEAQKGIDNVKAEIAELRKQMDDPESKALSEQYTAITKELDEIKAEQDDAFKNLNALRDERTKAHEDQQKKYSTVKEIKDAYYQQRRAAVDYEREAKRVREEKRRAENDAYHRGKRQEAAKAKLEEASAPAYSDEIRTTEVVLARLDPSSASKAEAAGPGKFAATNFRTVDAAGIKGTALKKKGEDDEDYFVGGGGKKNKRNRGQAGAGGVASPAPAESKFNLDLGTIRSLSEVGVDPPMSQADVPAVVEKLKEKLAFWKGDQDRKTKENVANAQKEIDRLEAEAQSAHEPSSSSTAKGAPEKQVNGSATSTAAGAEKDVTEKLEATKIAGEDAAGEKAA